MVVAVAVSEARPEGHEKLALLPSSVAGLPRLDDVFARRGVAGLSIGYPELFEGDARMFGLADGTVLVFRHDDLRRLGPDPRVGEPPTDLYLKRIFSGPPDNPLTESERENFRLFQVNQFFTARPAVHGLTKPIFAMPLMPKGMPPLEAIGERVLGAIVDKVAGAGEVDLFADVASAMAVEFWCEVMRLTPEERGALRVVARRISPIFVGPARSRDLLVDANRAIPDYFGLLVPALRRARASGDHLFLNGMAERFAAIHDAPEDMPFDIDHAFAANIIDGYHAMATALSTTMHHLLENPDALESVRADPGLAGPAVDEALRLNSPVSAFVRYMAEDVEIDGLCIPEGTFALMHWAAGNRDPAIHDDPDRYRLGRPHRPLTTFGAGVQICPGRNISRALGAMGVRMLLGPGLSVRLTGRPEWHPGTPMTPAPYSARIPVEIVRG